MFFVEYEIRILKFLGTRLLSLLPIIDYQNLLKRQWMKKLWKIEKYIENEKYNNMVGIWYNIIKIGSKKWTSHYNSTKTFSYILKKN